MSGDGRTPLATLGGRWMHWRSIVLGLPLGVVASWNLAAQCPDGSPPPCRAQPPGTATAPAPNSVAVLHFDNLSADTADAYLVSGLTEEITDRLGDIDQLQVKSRASVRRLQQSSVGDLAVFGRLLGVRYFVEGSVRRAGPRVRVSIRLVRADDGFRVWGGNFDRAVTDLLALQEEIASEVATNIAGRVLPKERVRLRQRPTTSGAAYEHFLRGNYALARRSQRSIATAIEAYRSATRLDPAFRAAHARIAYSYALLWLASTYGTPGPAPDSLLDWGFAAANYALEQDSSTADAWLALGLLRSFREPRGRTGVREALERAIALDPRNTETLHQYGDLLREVGLDSAAVAAYERALALEPERPITLVSLALVSLGKRRYDEAKRWIDSALTVDPALSIGRHGRFLIDWVTGDTAGARVDAMWLNQPAYLALLDLRQGDTLGARRRIAATLAPGLQGSHPLSVPQAIHLAFVLVASGQPEQAVPVLERAAPRGAALWSWLRMPWFDLVRSDPRFQRLVEESLPR